MSQAEHYANMQGNLKPLQYPHPEYYAQCSRRNTSQQSQSALPVQL
jgi:hypothetical protein